MRKYNPRLQDPEKVLKCACGEILRQKDWADHWRACYKASARPATEEETKSLLLYEEHRRQEDAKHEQWRNTELPLMVEEFRKRGGW